MAHLPEFEHTIVLQAALASYFMSILRKRCCLQGLSRYQGIVFQYFS
jgi:hypothetical protein